MRVTVKFVPANKPAGKLADAELLFDGGLLDGLRLIGFSVWQKRVGGGRVVTFPARSYAVNGERRTFSLLRSGTETGTTNEKTLRELLLDAFLEAERQSYDSVTDAGTDDSGMIIVWDDNDPPATAETLRPRMGESLS